MSDDRSDQNDHDGSDVAAGERGRPAAGSEIQRVLDRLGAVQDLLTVRKVFGEAYEVDGTTIVPVALVQGGGGGGGGEGSTPGEDGSEIGSTGMGGGLGFGMRVRPVGIYKVRDGEVSWVPAVDVMRLLIGGQLLLGLALLVVGWRRRRG